MLEPESFHSFGGSGDFICLMSAVHTYARLNNRKCYINHFKEVIDCYNDDVIGFGKTNNYRFINICYRHNKKYYSNDINYLGTFIRALSNDISLPVPFELPSFPKEESRCLIQLEGVTLPHQPKEFLQYIVDSFLVDTGRLSLDEFTGLVNTGIVKLIDRYKEKLENKG